MSEGSDNQYSEELGEIMTAALEQKGLSIKGLSRKLDISYEHARRMSHGYPQAKPMLKLVCKLLDLDVEKMEELSVQASINRRFPGVAMRIAGIDPELEPVERLWRQLKSDQKDDVITLMRAMAKRNNASQ